MSAEEIMRDALRQIMLKAPLGSGVAQIANEALLRVGPAAHQAEREDHCTGATTSDDRGEW